MSRLEQLDKAFTDALHNATLSMTGVAQTIHRAVPDVKHVALVINKDENQYTFSVLFHDRERLSVSLYRMEEGEELPEGEREVIREVEPSVTVH